MATNSYQKLICMYETSWHECSFSKGNLQQAKKNCDPFHHTQRTCPCYKENCEKRTSSPPCRFFQREIQFAKKKEREEFKRRCGVCVVP